MDVNKGKMNTMARGGGANGGPRKSKAFPVPKPRTRIEDPQFLRWLTTKPCLFCGSPALEPHHVRWGQGPGKGSASRKPDDYRALNTCYKCHCALHGGDKSRLQWMMRTVGREGVYSTMLDNLIEWISIRD